MALVQIGGENITVSSTAIGPTAAEVTDEVFVAEFQVKRGGALYCNTKDTPTAPGTNGDIGQGIGSRWRVVGHDEVLNFKMIATDVDATVAVQYFGTGK